MAPAGLTATHRQDQLQYEIIEHIQHNSTVNIESPHWRGRIQHQQSSGVSQQPTSTVRPRLQHAGVQTQSKPQYLHSSQIPIGLPLQQGRNVYQTAEYTPKVAHSTPYGTFQPSSSSPALRSTQVQRSIQNGADRFMCQPLIAASAPNCWPGESPRNGMDLSQQGPSAINGSGYPPRTHSLPQTALLLGQQSSSCDVKQLNKAVECETHSDGIDSMFDWDYYEKAGGFDPGLLLPVEGQQAKKLSKPDSPATPLTPSLLQGVNNRSSAQSAAGSSTSVSPNDAIDPTLNTSQPDWSSSENHEDPRPSRKHCRDPSVFDSPTPASSYTLSASPPTDFVVTHKRYGQSSWNPMGMNEGNFVRVDPNGYSTTHPRKRVRGIGSKNRDSMAIHEEHLRMRSSAPRSGDSTPSMTSSRTPELIDKSQRQSSNVSVHSNLRDSGYVSQFDSAVNSIRSSFASLTLADNVHIDTDCKDADDGFVDVNVEAKWRMRRSRFDVLRGSPIILPQSWEESQTPNERL